MTKTSNPDHILIPKHTKLSEKEKQELLDLYGITTKSLPFIHTQDPGITNLNVKPGDIIKIERKSQTAGNTLFYRSVVE